MDTETLERLVVDRALGALPPDCEALLAAYLEMRPEVAANCLPINRTVDLARQVVVEEPAGRLPVFPALRLARAHRNARLRLAARNLVAVAASVLIGFAVHAVVFPGGSPQPRSQGSFYVRTEGPSPEGDVSAAQNSGFWSARRLYERSADGFPPTRRLIWDSPVSVPRIGDET